MITVRPALIRFGAPCVVLVFTGPALAQGFPAKPVRIVTTVPGGGLDITALVIAPKLGERLGQQVIVDNRGSAISVETVQRAPGDGYNLLLASAGLWLSPFMRSNTPWDPVRDFAPISLLVTSPNIIVVHPSLPVKSVKELITFAKARLGELNYSSGQSGGSGHIAGELFKSQARVDISRVAYKGLASATLALLTGEVQLSFPNASAATTYVKAGRVRGLAVTSLQPSLLAPGLQTAASSGLPGYESRAIMGLFAPAKTPSAIVDQLNAEVVRVLTSVDVRQRLFDSGSEAAPSTPAELLAAIKSEMATTGKLIKDAGIRAE